MGVTHKDIQLLEDIIKEFKPGSVLELGAQQNYAQPNLPAPYIREWYESKGIFYRAIDISGEDGCGMFDLSKPMDNADAINKALNINGAFMKLMGYDKIDDDYHVRMFDLVTDFGTSEHIGVDGVFSWEAIYNCWKTKFDLCKIGGIIISENPKTGNWPTHGFQYYTRDFYVDLALYADLELLMYDEICAMGNCKDGMNILTVFRKFSDRFPTLEMFKSFDLRQA